MPTQRLSMRRIREVLRLRHQGLTERVIARTLGVSNGVVHGYVRRARLAGLTWPLPEGIDDEGLELLLFPAPAAASQSDRRPVPDWVYVEKELRRRSVTRLLLWEEYRAANPDGFGYTWFCTTFEAWKKRARPSMRQTHVGGEKVFVDFAGDTIDIFDPITGEAHAMKLFVAAMGASNYTYALPHLRQTAAGEPGRDRREQAPGSDPGLHCRAAEATRYVTLGQGAAPARPEKPVQGRIDGHPGVALRDLEASRAALSRSRYQPRTHRKDGYATPDRVTFLTGANRDFPKRRRHLNNQPITDDQSTLHGSFLCGQYRLHLHSAAPQKHPNTRCWLLWNKSFIFLSSVRALTHGGRNHARSVRARDQKIQKNSSRTNRCGLQGAQRVDVAHLIETGSTPHRPGQDTRAASRARLHSGRMGWPGRAASLRCSTPRMIGLRLNDP
jgi:hypothetical protein